MPTKYCGSDFRVEVFIDPNWEQIPGERSSTGTINVEQVDTTMKDDVPWRRLNDCGIKSADVNMAGVVRDDSTKALFNFLMARTFDDAVIRLRLQTGSDPWLEGLYRVFACERSGEYNGAEMYTVSFSLVEAPTLSLPSTYRRPGGVFTFRRPGGVSVYVRP